MITKDQIKEYKKDELINVSEKINKEDIKQLIECLTETDDKVRYPSSLILEYRSDNNNDVNQYFNVFIDMLKSDNSYFRTIGAKMIAHNTKWNKAENILNILDKYLDICEDEKMTAARVTIQNLHYIINGIDFDKKICDKIVNKLISIDILKRPNTNWKVMTTDVVNILMEIQKEISYKEIITYLNSCLNGNIIDKKLKKEIEELLN